MALYCVGFATDHHIPFHSKRNLGAVMNCFADSNLKALYLGGDVADTYWCHGHGAKHPNVHAGFEVEKQAVCKYLDEIDQCFSDIPKHFIEGNHETRFERWIVNNAPQLFGVTQMKSILEFERRKNWHYYDFNPRQLVRIQDTNLYAKHAPPGSSAAQIMNKSSCNLIFGHIHRYISDQKITGDRKLLRIFSPGWLGDIRFDQVFGYVQGHHNWQNGAAKIWIDDETKVWWIEHIQVINGLCVSNGKIYRA